MGIINQLSPQLVEKIAAGEVVERPASIVKELIENAIDAEATSIVIKVEGGGLTQISVLDDGRGMDVDDATLCIQPHSTSKLKSEADLWRIETMGFRGEALSAIAAISKFAIETKPGKALEGTRVAAEGGAIRSVAPSGCPAGTQVTVVDLFFNTPARLKFLKSEKIEYGHIEDVVRALALSFPRIRFELWRGEKRQFVSPATDFHQQRIADMLGGEIAEKMTAINEVSGGLRLYGWLGGEGLDRPNNKLLYLFVNGRPLRDRLLAHAVSAGYGEFLMRGRYPTAVLFLDIDPAIVDVNVHPMKREVRFENGGAVHDFIMHAVKKGVQAHLGGVQSAVESFERRRLHEVSDQAEVPERQGAQVSLPTFSPEPKLRLLGQLGETYIVCEGEYGSMVLVDQHAAHERLGYDALKRQAAKGNIEQQRLLIPEQVTLSPKEAALLEEHLELLTKAGFDIEPFGNASFVIKGAPSLLRDCDQHQLIEKIVEELSHFERSASLEAKLDHLFATTACHRQIRGGDRLSFEEMRSLLLEMEREKVTHCPHGRPVMMTLGKGEIEKRFKRV